MTQYDRLGHYIAMKRKEMNLSQEELAGKMNVSKSAIAKWETGGGLPDRDNLYTLAETLKVSIESLYQLASSDEGKPKTDEVNITKDIIELLKKNGYTVMRTHYFNGKERV